MDDLGSTHRPSARKVPQLAVPNLRILILGLGEPKEGNNGIGGRLARSLFASFRRAEVQSANEFVSYAEILRDYDLVVVLNSISFCSNVGHVSLGSPSSLADGWGSHPAQAEAFANALSYARLMGHRLPRIKVVNVCVGSEEWPEVGLSPTIASTYRDILGRVRALVKDVIREAERDARQRPG